MNAREDEFMQALLAAFRDEAAEHLQAMGAALLELENVPGAVPPPAAVEKIYREAHSLKGASRAVNRADVESVCQTLESVFAKWKSGASLPPPAGFDVLHQALDRMRSWVGAPAAGDAAPLCARLEQMGGAPPAGVPAGSESRAAAAEPAPAAGGKPVAPETVRIATAKLDILLTGLEEMLAVKLTIRRRAGELRGLAAGFELWHKEWGRLRSEWRRLRGADAESRHGDVGTTAGTAGAGAPLPPGVAEFLTWNEAYVASLEQALRTTAHAAQQDQHAVGMLVDDLLAESKRLLMLPCQTLLCLLPKLVRDLCREQGKDAVVVTTGGDVEMDKRILEELKDPLIHLVRNCVDHGLEPAAARAAAGKPERGTVTVSVAQGDGGKAVVRVSDDGSGIDLAQVKAAAVAHGAISAAEAQAMDDAATLALIFRSGVSTSANVTELSGRGLGLAIVREKVEKLGGHVAVETQIGKGTVFRLTLPMTLAALRGLLVKAGGQTFVIPTAGVERVSRVRPNEIRTALGRETLVVNGQALLLVWLADILGLPRAQAPEARQDVPLAVVVMGVAERRIGFVVEEVIAEEEILLKPFARPLARVRNLAGATVLGTGRAVPVLNVSDLLRTAAGAGETVAGPARDGGAPSGTPPAAVHRRVLLVEDSITARMLLKDILTGAGYQVTTAVDGVDAWLLLRTDEFEAVVSDVEMPRLNGFDLTAKIRADAKLAELPVVLVTALASPADRERGIDVGASAYVVKGSFDQNNLLQILARLV